MQVKLLDANALGYSFYCSGEPRLSPQGIQTQAVWGFLIHILNAIRAEPTLLNVVVWDGRAQWRYDLHPGYKSGRHKTVEQQELRAGYEKSVPVLKQFLSMLPVIQVRAPSAEADDLAFGLSRRLSHNGHLVTVRTSDYDWLQMVNQRCQWENARKKGHLVELAGFQKTSGYASPQAVASVKALMGDVSDDINGLEDVGDKRAAALVAKYGAIPQILTAAEDLFTFSDEPKYFHSLMLPENRELVHRNYRLVNLELAPPIDPSSVELVVGEFDSLNLYEGFVDYGYQQGIDFFSLWEKLAKCELAKPDVLTIKKAVQELEKAWAR